MLRCLTPEQFDDLVEGRLEPLDLEASEAHVEACPACREQFLEHTRIADAEDWRRAAWELPPPGETDAGFLAELKTLDVETAAERVGHTVDHADLFDGQSPSGQCKNWEPT